MLYFRKTWHGWEVELIMLRRKIVMQQFARLLKKILKKDKICYIVMEPRIYKEDDYHVVILVLQEIDNTTLQDINTKLQRSFYKLKRKYPLKWSFALLPHKEAQNFLRRNGKRYIVMDAWLTSSLARQLEEAYYLTFLNIF